MKVTFLGTGTSVGVPMIGCPCEVCTSTDSRDKRLRTSVLLQFPDFNIVIDTGPDFRQQILSIGISNLEAILFTHEHRDHTAGLDDIRPFNFLNKKSIDAFATERVQAELKKQFYYIFRDHEVRGLPQVNLKTFGDQDFSIRDVEITPIQVMHNKLPVSGFRIGNFTYITDAKTIAEKEKEKIRGSEILVLNALRKEDHFTHLTFDEAIALAKELEVPKVYFTHFSHQLGRHADISKELPVNIELAYDGLELQC